MIEEKSASTCRHHWVIQPATGPVSQGVCQNCDQTKEFKNYIEASSWGDERLSARSRVESPVVVADTSDDEDVSGEE